MPIYDHNGNVLSEVSKIWDDDGTTSSLIGRVYDWDGTADSLIYDLDPGLIVGSDALSSEITNPNNWTWRIASGLSSISTEMIQNTNTNTSSATDAWLCCTQPLPKGYTSLTFTFVREGGADIRFIIGTSIQGYNVLNVNTSQSKTISINHATDYYISLAVYGAGKGRITYLKLA